MANENLKIFGNGVILHDNKYFGIFPYSLKKEEQEGHSYYLHAAKLRIDIGKETEIKDVKIPITEVQYKKLKKQFKNSKAECPQFVLRGELEIIVESVCIN